MRGATECAKRLKLYFSSLRSKLGKVGTPSVGDPISQLILGVLSRNVPETKASDGLDRLRSMVVDYNELRVIAPIELAELLHDFPDARLKCEDISRALNKIFMAEHEVTLDRVAELPRRELLAYIEDIDGLEAYSRARIRLLGFRQHAIPLDEAMWALARKVEIVAPRCPLEEAQQFLERQIAPEDALEFVALFKKQAWQDMSAAVRKGAVESIQSVPPDRTSRNMLQAVVASQADAAMLEESKAEEEKAAAKKSKPRKSKPKSAAASSAKKRKPSTKKKPKAAPRKAKAASRGKSARSKKKTKTVRKKARQASNRRATPKRAARKSAKKSTRRAKTKRRAPARSR